jgi:hypothetical protein
MRWSKILQTSLINTGAGQKSERDETIELDRLRVERWITKKAAGHYMRPILHAYLVWDPVLHRRLAGKPLKPRGDLFSLSARKSIERSRQEHQDLLADFESLLRGVETAAAASNASLASVSREPWK